MTTTRIIVADPCSDNRETLAELLRHFGFAAEAVPDLATLADRLREAPADLVITEIFDSPGATCRAVRAAAPRSEICLYTAWARPGDARDAAALNCRLVIKPEEVARLVPGLADRPPAGPPGQRRRSAAGAGRAGRARRSGSVTGTTASFSFPDPAGCAG